MCGRFALYSDKSQLELFLGIRVTLDIPVRYNIAPTQSCLFLKAEEKGRLNPSILNWGLIPSWASDKSMAGKMINARAESISEKPSFKSAIRKRRGIIPANGFYEWMKIGKSKHPYFISAKDRPLLGFAGIWERNQNIGTTSMETFSIITTEANEDMNKIHDRMPLILPRGDWEKWLNHELDFDAEISPMLTPPASGLVKTMEVGTFVNKVGNDSSNCLAPPQADLFSNLD